MKEAEDTRIVEMHADKDSIELTLRTPHWAVAAMAESFYDTLADAPNWRCVELPVTVPGKPSMLVTVCRASGDSPVETVTKCKDFIERILWVVNVDIHVSGSSLTHVDLDKLEALAIEGRALLNPEKKD